MGNALRIHSRVTVDQVKPDEKEEQAIAGRTKAEVVEVICRIIRKAGLDYEGWRYVSKRVRLECELSPKKKGRRLPRVLTAEEFRRFYDVVDKASNVQHALMLRLLFYSGLRVSELCGLKVADVDLESGHVRVNAGKGDKDRVCLIPPSFLLTLRTHLEAHPANRWVFQTQRHSKYTARRVQQVVARYAALAGVAATPHTFRHQAITWLTRHAGLADAELQLLTGHAKRETLAVYQHVALDVALESKYQAAMKQLSL